MYTGAETKVVAAMHRYGMSAGIAFQIVDDVLDIAGDSHEVGKSLGLDAALGKLTLPTIHALEQSDPQASRQIIGMTTGELPYDRTTLRSLLERTSSLEYSLATANQYVADAIDQLVWLDPSEAKSSLTALAEFIVHRRF